MRRTLGFVSSHRMGEISYLFIGIIGLLSASVLGTTATGWGAITVPLLILAGIEPVAAISASLIDHRQVHLMKEVFSA
ncbi:MAG: hypothetical protein HY347_08430 [candidate division NC10 bacterium]|nr:hypothetical protein [candidate division NC10 bacterium]